MDRQIAVLIHLWSVALKGVLLAAPNASRCRVGVLAVLAIAGLAQASSAQAPNAITVPIRWQQQQQQETGAPASELSGGRRLAVMLIDRSGSMDFYKDGTSRSRWERLLSSLDEALIELARVSPGIELEVRFFDNELDCSPPIRKVLDSRASATAVTTLIKSLGPPRTVGSGASKRGGTALYAAVSRVASSLTTRVEEFQWMLFAVYSDGEDTDSAPEFTAGGASDWQRAVRALSDRFASVRGQALAVAVGPEAEEMIKNGVFKQFVPGALGGVLPKPPPPPCRVGATFAAPFDGRPPIGPLLKRGDAVAFRISTSVAPAALGQGCDAGALPGQVQYRLRVDAASPFKLAGADVVPGGGGEARFILQGDGDEGATLRFDIVPQPAPGGAMVVSERPLAISASFRPAKSPPTPDSWRLNVPPFVRVGAPALISVDNLGPEFALEWRFEGGVAPNAAGPSCSPAFAKAGMVKGALAATSADGKGGRREFALEVIDGAFDIRAEGKLVRGKPIVLLAEPRGPSECEYRWEVGGQRFDGRRITFVPASLGEVDVRCTATSRKGSLEFVASGRFAVADEPKIVIASPDSLREGSSSLRVLCYLAEVDGSPQVRLRVGGRELAVKQPKPSEGILQVDFDLPLAAADWQQFGAKLRIEAEVVGGSLRDEREVPIVEVEGLRAQLKSPIAGAVIPFGRNTELALEVAGPEADRRLVESMSIRVVDARGVSVLIGEPKPGSGVEKAAPNFSVSIMPEAGKHQAPLRIEALIKGGSLRPRTAWSDAGQLGLELSKAQFTISKAGGGALEATAYKPVTLELQGVPAGETVTVRWLIDGRQFGDGGRTPTIEGLPVGLYRVSAEVVRSDGSRMSVGPTGLEVGSSLSLRAGDGTLKWDSGDPPAATIELVGEPQELAQVARVQWSGAKVDPSNPRVATLDFPPVSSADSDALSPRTVTAIAEFGASGAKSSPLTIVITPKPAPPVIGTIVIKVAGVSEQGARGGPLTVEKNISGVWAPGRTAYSYEPTDAAKSRGQLAVKDRDLPAELTVDQGADGLWTVRSQVIPYGGGRPVEGSATFAKTRAPDLTSFLVAAGVTLALACTLGYLNALNGGLGWSVRLCGVDEVSIQNAIGVQPKVFKGVVGWSLWKKQAEVDLLQLRTDPFFRDARFAWFKATSPNGASVVRWNRDGLPTLHSSVLRIADAKEFSGSGRIAKCITAKQAAREHGNESILRALEKDSPPPRDTLDELANQADEEAPTAVSAQPLYLIVDKKQRGPGRFLIAAVVALSAAAALWWAYDKWM